MPAKAKATRTEKPAAKPKGKAAAAAASDDETDTPGAAAAARASSPDNDSEPDSPTTKKTKLSHPTATATATATAAPAAAVATAPAQPASAAAAAATPKSEAGSVEVSTLTPLVPYGGSGTTTQRRPFAANLPPGLAPAAVQAMAGAAGSGYVFASSHYNTAGAPKASGAWDGALNTDGSNPQAGTGALPPPPGTVATTSSAPGAPPGVPKRKWARVQVDKPNTSKQQRPEGQNEYNIWYGKYLGDKNDNRERERAQTRCVLWRDAGMTMADVKADQPYFCIHFARGGCMHGPNCTFLHRLPDERDYGRIDMMHDIFGRDRHASDREDMDGVGCFNREGRTLWVTNFSASRQGVQEVVARHFGEWGAMEECAIKPKHKCAFIRYVHRLNAEFAKVAMAEQSLDHNEQLTMRWAHEDPNPVAQRRIQRDYEQKTAAAIRAKGVTAEVEVPYNVPAGYLPPTASSLPALLPDAAAAAIADAARDPTKKLEAYPDTDQQFGAIPAPVPVEAPAPVVLDPNDPATAYHRQLAQEQADAAHQQAKLYDVYAAATAAVTRSGNEHGVGLDMPTSTAAAHQQQMMQYQQQMMAWQQQQYAAAAAAGGSGAVDPAIAAQAAQYAAYYASQGVYQTADGKWVYPQQSTAAGAGGGAAASTAASSSASSGDAMAPMGREQAMALQAQNDALAAQQAAAAAEAAAAETANSFAALLDKIDSSKK